MMFGCTHFQFHWRLAASRKRAQKKRHDESMIRFSRAGLNFRTRFALSCAQNFFHLFADDFVRRPQVKEQCVTRRLERAVQTVKHFFQTFSRCDYAQDSKRKSVAGIFFRLSRDRRSKIS
jgi:hypothetical protein